MENLYNLISSITICDFLKLLILCFILLTTYHQFLLRTNNNLKRYNCHTEIVSAPISIIGGSDYYQWRYNNFNKRYHSMGFKAPKYYLSYGKKYCEAFEKLKPSLSGFGQTWVDKTAYSLQVRMEKLLQNRPSVEVNEKELKKCAYQSHTDAYLESGFKYLPLSDILKISQTISFWDKVIGIVEISAVGKIWLVYRIKKMVQFRV